MKTKHILWLGSLLALLQVAAAQGAEPIAYPDGFSGKVISSTNVAGYTYVQVDTGSNQLWAATTQFPVAVGDSVKVGRSTPMPGYHSKSLNRTFDVVYFAESIGVNGANAGGLPALPPGHPAIGGASPALPPGHPSITGSSVASSLDLTGIQRAEGGKTVQEIYAAKAQLAGKPVTVRGKVVKYNPMIMGKNWLHIRDGSGAAVDGNNDLTVTTTTPAALGATVLVTGNVSTNRDFGAGYKYNVILEDAQVKVE